MRYDICYNRKARYGAFVNNPISDHPSAVQPAMSNNQTRRNPVHEKAPGDPFSPLDAVRHFRRSGGKCRHHRQSYHLHLHVSGHLRHDERSAQGPVPQRRNRILPGRHGHPADQGRRRDGKRQAGLRHADGRRARLLPGAQGRRLAASLCDRSAQQPSL